MVCFKIVLLNAPPLPKIPSLKISPNRKRKPTPSPELSHHLTFYDQIEKVYNYVYQNYIIVDLIHMNVTLPKIPNLKISPSRKRKRKPVDSLT